MDSELKICKKSIQNGHADLPAVQNEYGSSYKITMDRLQNPEFVQYLEHFSSLMIIPAEAKEEQNYNSSLIDVSFFTNNIESKRKMNSNSELPDQSPISNLLTTTISSLGSEELPLDVTSWIKMLNNPNFSTNSLIISFPFELKGDQMLRSLVKNKTFLHRALLAIRIFGIIAAISRWSRSKERSKNVSQESNSKCLISYQELVRYLNVHTEQWTIAVLKVLDEYAGKAEVLARSFEKDSTSPINTLKWQRDWDYFQDILSSLFSERLLIQQYFIKWILSRFDKAGPAVSALYFKLIIKYINHISKSRTTSRRLISSLAKKISIFNDYNESLYGKVLLRLLYYYIENGSDILVEIYLWPQVLKSVFSDGHKSISYSTVSAIIEINERYSQLCSSNNRFFSQYHIISNFFDFLIPYSNGSNSIAKIIENHTVLNNIFQPLVSNDPLISEQTKFIERLFIWAFSYSYNAYASDYTYRKPLVVVRVLLLWCNKKLDQALISKKLRSNKKELILQEFSIERKNRIQSALLDLITRNECILEVSEFEEESISILVQNLVKNNLIDWKLFLIRLVSCGFLEPFDAKNENLKLRSFNLRKLIIIRLLVKLPFFTSQSNIQSLYTEDDERIPLLDNAIKSLQAYTVNNVDGYRFLTDFSEIPNLKSRLVVLIYNELPYLFTYLGFTRYIAESTDSFVIKNLNSDIYTQCNNSGLFNKPWTCPLPQNSLPENTQQYLLTKELNSYLLAEAPRSLVYSFLSFELYISLTKEFVIKPTKVEKSNWKTITKVGASLLDINQLCIVARIYQQGKCEFSLIELLLWLLDGKCFTVLIESMAYKILLQQFDEICGFGYAAQVFHVFKDICSKFDKSDKRSAFNYNCLLSLRRFSRMCVKKNIPIDLDPMDIATIEKDFFFWLNTIQEKLKIVPVITKLGSINDPKRISHIISFAFRSSVSSKLDHSLPVIFEKSSKFDFDWLDTNDFICLAEEMFSNINTHISSETTTLCPKTELFDFPINIASSEQKSKINTQHRTKLASNPRNSEVLDTRLLTDILLSTIFLSASKCFAIFISQCGKSKSHTYKLSYFITGYIHFLVTALGADVLGDKLRNKIENCLEELVFGCKDETSAKDALQTSYFISFVLVCGGFLDLQHYLKWVGSKLIEKKSITPQAIFIIVETLIYLFSGVSTSYSELLKTPEHKPFRVEHLSIVEFYSSRFSWKILIKDSPIELYNDVVVILFKLVSLLNESSVHKDYNTFSTILDEMNLLSSCIGLSDLQEESYSFLSDSYRKLIFRKIDSNLTSNDPEIKCSLFEKRTPLFLFTVTELLHSTFHISPEYLEKKCCSNILLTILLLNQPVLTNNQTEHVNRRLFIPDNNQSINGHLLQLNKLTPDVIWRKMNLFIHYWANQVISEYSMFDETRKSVANSKCGICIKSVYQYSLFCIKQGLVQSQDAMLELSLVQTNFRSISCHKQEELFDKVAKLLGVDKQSVSNYFSIFSLFKEYMTLSRETDENLVTHTDIDNQFYNISTIISFKAALTILNQLLLEYAFLETEKHQKICMLELKGYSFELQNDMKKELLLFYSSITNDLFTQFAEMVTVLPTDIRSMIYFILTIRIALIVLSNFEYTFLKGQEKQILQESKNLLFERLLQMQSNFSLNDNFPGSEQITASLFLGFIRITDSCDSCLFYGPEKSEIKSNHYPSYKITKFQNQILESVYQSSKKQSQPSVSILISQPVSSNLLKGDQNNTATSGCQYCTKILLRHYIPDLVKVLRDLSHEYVSFCNPHLYNIFELKPSSVYKLALKPLDESNISSKDLAIEAEPLENRIENISILFMFFVSKVLLGKLEDIRINPVLYFADQWLLLFLSFSTGDDFFGKTSFQIEEVVGFLNCSRLKNIEKTRLNKDSMFDTREFKKKETGQQFLILQYFLDFASTLSDLATQENKSNILSTLQKILPFKPDKIGKRYSFLLCSKESNYPVSNPWLQIESFGTIDEAEPKKRKWFSDIVGFNPVKRRADVEKSLYS
ncbi:hypothetical protein BB560_000144 [Smittium megazygosporum]|uniref:Uncharacterized protein n=1 Tax=Smittium megazygosporum TaxID=133381 RepID=A0A2T9ZLA9_9FUNG|nr:hypothetical protein BB560_000144 [Smittium megazygosporum]